jgi:hypothetical protein
LRALEFRKYEEGTSASFKVNDNEVTDVSNMPQNRKSRSSIKTSFRKRFSYGWKRHAANTSNGKGKCKKPEVAE